METINVLDHGFVTLIDHMGSDLRTVNAARISFAKHKDEFDGADKTLVGYLGEHQHNAPMRHNKLTLHVKLPIFVMRQLVKHRIDSEINEVSGRYVNAANTDIFVPAEFRRQAVVNKQGSEGLVDNQDAARNAYLLANRTAIEQYNAMIDLGVCKEQARCVLPLGMYTEIYWTLGLQAACNFIALREDSHAQWEIQQYGHAVRTFVEQLFPYSSKALLENHPVVHGNNH